LDELEKLKKKTTYQFPDISKDQILYKGRRYLMFAIDPEHPFSGFEKNFTCVVWDGSMGVELAVGNINANGKYYGELTCSHVGIDVPESETPKEFVSWAASQNDWYFKSVGG